MDNNKIVDNIRLLCNQNGITVSQLERKLNLSPGLISRWSKSTPSLDRLQDISRYFNVLIDDILEDTCRKRTSAVQASALIHTLTRQSLKNQLVWRIFDPFRPDELGPNIQRIISPSDGDSEYFYTAFDSGFFLLIAVFCQNDVSLDLYALPDKRSIPQHISNDVEELSNLYDYIEGQLNTELSRLKSQKFIKDFCSRFSDDSRSARASKTQEGKHISPFPEGEKTALRFG